MKDIEQIKEELKEFGKKYDACEEGLEAIKGNNLTELFQNINVYIYWCKEDKEKTEVFNNIFNNKLVIENETLLCDCTGLSSVIIPEYVTLIDDYAFGDCKKSTSVIIPDSITSIKRNVFSGCKKYIKNKMKTKRK